jgi:hypothetical protein
MVADTRAIAARLGEHRQRSVGQVAKDFDLTETGPGMG